MQETFKLEPGHFKGCKVSLAELWIDGQIKTLYLFMVGSAPPPV